MALYDVFLIGMAGPARIELPVRTVRELADRLTHRRYLEGELVDPETGLVRDVLISTQRMQFIVEADVNDG